MTGAYGRQPIARADRGQGSLRITAADVPHNISGVIVEDQPVLVDGLAAAGDHYVGRTHADAPEVDALVMLPDAGLRPGQVVDVEITGFEEYDLVGRPKEGAS